MSVRSIAPWLVAATLFLVAPAQAGVCVGDCDGNGTVTVDELVRAVNIALGTLSLSQCGVADRNGDQVVSVDELVAAVNAALAGCVAEPTPTATPSPTPSPTPINRPPMIAPLPIYRTYPGFQVQLPITAVDPDGQTLRYSSLDLPAGAQLDVDTGVLSWLPQVNQLGSFYAGVQVTDSGVPPRSAEGIASFSVAPLDSCVVPVCDPATGCTSALLPLGTDCCSEEPQVRISEPTVRCPEGSWLIVGRNRETPPGRLYNCDRLRDAGGAQGGGKLRLNVQARCLKADLATIRARIETADQVVVDETLQAVLTARDGYVYSYGLAFPLGELGAPDGTEGDLTVTVTDADGVSLTQTIRVELTPEPLAELPN